MKIHCFYERWNLNDVPLVGLWVDAWRAQGWDPVVLSIPDAKRHRLYGMLEKRIANYPTVNNRRYENLCYLRWCAYALVGGMCVDYDVLPRAAFPPQEWRGFINGCRCIDPGCVAGDRDRYELFIHKMINYKVRAEHVSDQIIIKENANIFTEVHHFCQCYGDEAWDSVPLTHFANGKLLPYDQASRVDQIRAILKV